MLPNDCHLISYILFSMPCPGCLPAGVDPNRGIEETRQGVQAYSDQLAAYPMSLAVY